MSAAINACFSFLWTLYVCHNYKKRLYNRNVLLRVKCLITLRLISAFFFFFLSKELVFDNFTNFKKEQQQLYSVEVSKYQTFY